MIASCQQNDIFPVVFNIGFTRHATSDERKRIAEINAELKKRRKSALIFDYCGLTLMKDKTDQPDVKMLIDYVHPTFKTNQLITAELVSTLF